MPSLIPDDLRDLNLAPPNWNWRNHQKTVAERIEASDKKIILLELEPGSGKSVIPPSVITAMGKTGLILVQTRQLERQYLRDFESMVMMEGRRHFDCEITGKYADTGPCTIGVKCDYAGKYTGLDAFAPTCPYYIQKFAARSAEITVHNYSYWLRESQSPFSVFADRDWIVCDEAHEIDQILMAAGEVRLRKDTIKMLKLPSVPNKRKDLTAWRNWSIRTYDALLTQISSLHDQAEKHGIKLRHQQLELRDEADAKEIEGWEDDILNADDEVEEAFDITKISAVAMDIINRIKHATEMRDLISTLSTLTDEEIEDEWVPAHEEKHYVFKPIYGKYAFDRIRQRAGEKVILMSAFLAPEMLAETLGLEEDEYEVIVGGEIFDRTNSPVLYCPTVRMNNRATDKQWEYAVFAMDQILNEFKDVKGLIHVPSYKLRNRILAQSKHTDRFITYGKMGERTKDEALLDFAKVGSRSDSVLLGQSISTGVDLPYIPKFNIVFKLAFPSTQDPAIKKRMEVDKQFLSFRTICELVQATGRIKRAPDDGGPTIILDATFDSWFWAANKQHFPIWFRKALRKDGWRTFPEIAKTRKRDAFKFRVLL